MGDKGKKDRGPEQSRRKTKIKKREGEKINAR